MFFSSIDFILNLQYSRIEFSARAEIFQNFFKFIENLLIDLINFIN